MQITLTRKEVEEMVLAEMNKQFLGKIIFTKAEFGSSYYSDFCKITHEEKNNE